MVALVALVLIPATASAADQAFDILPPGDFGGLPTTANSRDQLSLYDGLTPLLGHVTASDIRRFYKPETLGPSGPTRVEATPRPGVTIRRDKYGVPHITAKTRDDLYWAEGWVVAEDRYLLLSLGRGPARAAVADVPGLNAFGLVTTAGKFVPSAQTTALLTGEATQIKKRYGAKKGGDMLHAFDVYAQGVTARFKKDGRSDAPWSRYDVIATDAFIGSIFGNGGGRESINSDFLAKFRAKLRNKAGTGAWRDLMEGNDPEAPVTITKRFPYGTPGIGPTRGSLLVDAGSVTHVPDPAQAQASNFLVVSAKRSASGHPLAVMGPQLGYYYPEIVYEADLQAPGIRARGALVPGGGPFVLIGRTQNYAWSLTTATNDNEDEFMERLCGGDDHHYVYKGKCRAMSRFDAGQLTAGGQAPKELVYYRTVHGAIVGSATVKGTRFAIARARTTYGQDGNSIAALRDMTLGAGATVSGFYRAANEFGFTFNWAYAGRKHIAYFSSGRLPRRAPGLDPLLPTLGTGAYDWRGWLAQNQHPHQSDPAGGLLVNWNNKPAPGWTQGDDNHSYGSIHRKELFRGFPRKAKLQDVVSIMNRAATQDLRVMDVWPTIRAVLGSNAYAPDALSGQAASLLDAWRRHGGSRIDRNLDGKVDDPGAAIMDTAFPLMAHTLLADRLGATLTDDWATYVQPDQAPAGRNGSSFGGGWYEYVDKDLRRILKRKELGRFNLTYCGRGSLSRCRADLWKALQQATQQLSMEQGSTPSAWRADATKERISFRPGLISETMRWTNRPTFQQVIGWGAKP
jgi:acyl-homoserine lactone acylase PvdQ